jgi:purine-binding chemotaxis protein CheW
VRIRSQSGEKTVGLVVDAVSDVHSLPTASIKPTPDLCGRSGEACVNGLVTVDGKMVMLLDIDRLVNSSIEDAAPATAAAAATATAA